MDRTHKHPRKEAGEITNQTGVKVIGQAVHGTKVDLQHTNFIVLKEFMELGLQMVEVVRDVKEKRKAGAFGPEQAAKKRLGETTRASDPW